MLKHLFRPNIQIRNNNTKRAVHYDFVFMICLCGLELLNQNFRNRYEWWTLPFSTPLLSIAFQSWSEFLVELIWTFCWLSCWLPRRTFLSNKNTSSTLWMTFSGRLLGLTFFWTLVRTSHFWIFVKTDLSHVCENKVNMLRTFNRLSLSPSQNRQNRYWRSAQHFGAGIASRSKSAIANVVQLPYHIFDDEFGSFLASALVGGWVRWVR